MSSFCFHLVELVFDPLDHRTAGAAMSIRPKTFLMLRMRVLRRDPDVPATSTGSFSSDSSELSCVHLLVVASRKALMAERSGRKPVPPRKMPSSGRE